MPPKFARIDHPRSGKATHCTSFFAYGLACGVQQVVGTLIDKDGKPTTGKTFCQPKDSDTGFWMIQFKGLTPGRYTLEVREDAKGYALLDRHADVNVDGGEFGGPIIKYPTAADCPLPLEFGAYGTSTGTLTPTATMSNVGHLSTPQSLGPPSWGIHCVVTSPMPGTSTLTVKESDLTPMSTDSDPLTFGS
jgi:hypothetical protein